MGEKLTSMPKNTGDAEALRVALELMNMRQNNGTKRDDLLYEAAAFLKRGGYLVPAPVDEGALPWPRTGHDMIRRHRFQLAVDGNCAEIDSRGLAEEIDLRIAALTAQRDAGSLVIDFMRERIVALIAKLTAAEAIIEEMGAALEPFANCEPVNIWREEDEDAGNFVLTENQFRLAREALSHKGT